MKHVTSRLVVVAILTGLPGAASPCSRPPDIWTIEQSWPAAGAEGVPTDGYVVALGAAPFGGAGTTFRDVLTVEVRRDGVPIAGDLQPAPFSAEAVWRAAEPLAPHTVYEVRLKVENPDGSWFDGEFEGDRERTWTFTTGDAPAAEPPAPAVDAVSGEGWTREIRQCAEEPEPGLCGGCPDEVVVGTEARLRVEARVPRVDGPFGSVYIARLRVAPGRADLAEAGPAVATRFWDAGEARLAVDLGRAEDWPGDEVCVQAEVADPVGRVALGEPRCVGFDDRTEPNDQTSEWRDEPDGQVDPPSDDSDADADREFSRRRHEGCSATGAPAGGLLAGLALLLGLRRRPRHHRGCR